MQPRTFVLHSDTQAAALASYLRLNREAMAQAGTPLELYDQPANLFVAGFIGSPEINQLPGEVVLNGSVTSLRLKDGSLLALPTGMQVKHGQQVVYAIRPEQVNVVHEARDDALAAKVTAAAAM